MVLVPLLVAAAAGAFSAIGYAPSWAVSPGQPGSEFGAVVAGGLDVDGDGFDDVLVAAPLFSNGQTFEGAVFLYRGSASGPSLAPSWSFESDQAAAGLGSGLAAAGDVNGDGFDDVVIGAPDYDAPTNGEGRIYVFHGSASGLAPAPSFTWEPNTAGARMGAVVAGIGDVNGDGYDDVAAVQFGMGGGPVRVFHGSATGLKTPPATLLNPPAPGAAFGRALAGAGDVNGDGFDDLVVGAPLQELGQTDEGLAYLYLGSPSGIVTTFAWSAQSNASLAQFGHAVAGAGDVDGDGFDDVLIGAPYAPGTFAQEGRVFLYRGSSLGLQPQPAWSASGAQPAGEFGESLAGLGDLDFDGFADFAVGAPRHDAGHADAGRAFVYRGGPFLFNGFADASVQGNAQDVRVGSSVAGAGDVNGDGARDLLLGAHSFASGAQFAQLHLGAGAGPPVAGAVPYGPGKGAGTAPPPRLHSPLAPHLGTTASLVVDGGLAGASPVFLLLGLAPAALPFDGGTIHVSPLVVTPLPPLSASGGLLLPAPIPPDPLFLGLAVHLQVAYVDPAASGPQQSVLSNGLRWILGN